MEMTNNMSQSFRELVERINKRRKEQDDDENDLKYGNVGGKPRAKGEREFAKAATGYPIEDPTDPSINIPYPVKGTDDSLNARDTRKTKKHKPPVPGGEKEIVNQGTSKLPDQSGYKATKSKTRANADGIAGDTSVVRLSKSAVEPKGVLVEDFKNSLANISSSGKAQMIEFSDGDKALVNPIIAKKILELASNMGPNGKKTLQIASKSPAGMMKIMGMKG